MFSPVCSPQHGRAFSPATLAKPLPALPRAHTSVPQRLRQGQPDPASHLPQARWVPACQSACVGAIVLEFPKHRHTPVCPQRAYAEQICLTGGQGRGSSAPRQRCHALPRLPEGLQLLHDRSGIHAARASSQAISRGAPTSPGLNSRKYCLLKLTAFFCDLQPPGPGESLTGGPQAQALRAGAGTFTSN